MSYVVPGPPTPFNGTNEELGGDSSMFVPTITHKNSSSRLRFTTAKHVANMVLL